MKKLYFYKADWCQPCNMLNTVMERVSQIPIEKINIDYETQRTQAANVKSIPTVILVENDQEIRRFVGVRSYEQVLDFINNG